MIKKTYTKLLCSIITASMVFTSVPFHILADTVNDNDNYDVDIVEPSEVSETSSETEAVATTSDEVNPDEDTNTTSIPTDEDMPETEVTDEIETVPIVETDPTVSETDETVAETSETDETVETDETEETEETTGDVASTYNYSVVLPEDVTIFTEDTIIISADITATVTSIVDEEEITEDVDYTFTMTVGNDIYDDTTLTLAFDEIGEYVVNASLVVDGEEVASDSMTITVEEKDGYVEFDHYYSDIDESLVQTSDLMIKTSDSSVFTRNTNVVSNYGDVYIISCESVEEARFVYSYYVGRVDFITDLSAVIEVTDIDEDVDTDDESVVPTEDTLESEPANIPEIIPGPVAEDDVADLSDLNNGNDPIANLNDIDVTDVEVEPMTIALIDTGANTETTYSVIDSDTIYENGHGNTMLGYILEENPDANVISIKVAEDGSNANAADIYAGFRLAIDLNVDIISFSMVGFDNQNNAILKDIIQEAIDAGIVVVGSAGNNNTTARIFVPGCIDDVYTIGACTEGGVKYPMSNFDADYYVVGTSTSEATARFAGIYSADRLEECLFFNYVFETLDADEYAYAYRTASELTELGSEDGLYYEVTIDEDGTVHYQALYVPTASDMEVAEASTTWASERLNGAVLARGSYSGTCSFNHLGQGQGYAYGFSDPTVSAWATAIGRNSASNGIHIVCSGYFGDNGELWARDLGTDYPNGPFYFTAESDGEGTVHIRVGDRPGATAVTWTAVSDTITIAGDRKGGRDGYYEVTGITVVRFDGTVTNLISSPRQFASEAELLNFVRNRLSGHFSGKKNWDMSSIGIGRYTINYYNGQTQQYRGEVYSTGGGTPTPTDHGEGVVQFRKVLEENGVRNDLAGATIEFTIVSGDPTYTSHPIRVRDVSGATGVTQMTNGVRFVTSGTTVTINRLQPNCTYRFRETIAPIDPDTNAPYATVDDIYVTTDAEGNASTALVVMTNKPSTVPYGSVGIVKTWEGNSSDSYRFWNSVSKIDFTFYAPMTYDSIHSYTSNPSAWQLDGILATGELSNRGGNSATVEWIMHRPYQTLTGADHEYFHYWGNIGAGHQGWIRADDFYNFAGYERTFKSMNFLPRDRYYVVREQWTEGVFWEEDEWRYISTANASGWHSTSSSSGERMYEAIYYIGNDGVTYFCDWYSLNPIRALRLDDNGNGSGDATSDPDWNAGWTDDYYYDLCSNVENTGCIDVVKVDNTIAGIDGIRFELHRERGAGDYPLVATGTISGSAGTVDNHPAYNVNWTYTLLRPGAIHYFTGRDTTNPGYQELGDDHAVIGGWNWTNMAYNVRDLVGGNLNNTLITSWYNSTQEWYNYYSANQWLSLYDDYLIWVADGEPHPYNGAEPIHSRYMYNYNNDLWYGVAAIRSRFVPNPSVFDYNLGFPANFNRETLNLNEDVHRNEPYVAHLNYGTYYVYEYIEDSNGRNLLGNYCIPNGWKAWDNDTNREWHEGDAGTPEYFYIQVELTDANHITPATVTVTNRQDAFDIRVAKYDERTQLPITNYNGTYRVAVYFDLNNNGVVDSSDRLIDTITDGSPSDADETRDGVITCRGLYASYNYTNRNTYPTHFVVQEISAPNGYFVAGTPSIGSVSRETNYETTIIQADVPYIPLDFSAYKVDEATGERIDGATFALYVDTNEDGILDDNDRLLGTQTTGGANHVASWHYDLNPNTITQLFPECISSNGTITGESAKNYPRHYLIVETQAPDGYYINPYPEAITLSNGAYNAPVAVTIEDVAYIPIEFTVNKLDEETGNTLSGAVFALYVDVNNNDEVDDGDRFLDYATADSNGVANWSYTLDPDTIAQHFPECYIEGTATYDESTGLWNGQIDGYSVKHYPMDYVVVEVTPVDNYYLNSNAYDMTLAGARASASVEIDVVNRPYIEHDFTVNKLDEWTGDLLIDYVGDYDATFEIWCDVNENNVIDEDTDVLITTLADTDRDGVVTYHYVLTPDELNSKFPEIAEDVMDVNGSMDYYDHYLVREVTAPFDFYLNSNPYTLTLEPMVYDSSAENSVDDTPYQAQIVMHKLDGDTNEPISNAQFTIYTDVNNNQKFDEGIDTVALTYGGTAHTTRNAVITWDADSQTYVSDWLRSGHYIAVETGLPNHYFFVDANGVPTLARNEVYFEITPRDTSTQEFEIDTYEGTVYNLAPRISTTLIDPLTEAHIAHIDEECRLVDTVEYENLIPDIEYRMSGTLMIKENGEPLCDADGNPITGETVFTPHSPNGSVEVEYIVDTARLMRLVEEGTLNAPVDLVSFEVLDLTATEDLTPYHQWYDDGPVATHEDINDGGQTVRVGKVETGVFDNQSLSQVASMGPNGDGYATIIDMVYYEGVQPGLTYTVSGTMHILAFDDDGNPIDGGALTGGDGREILNPSVTFTPESYKGYVAVTYVINTNRLRGETLVSFEDLYYRGARIMWHSDITDLAQTLFVPDVHTNAYCPDTTPGDMGRTVISIGENARVVDEVRYENLLVDGREYMVQGTLYWMYTDENGVIHNGSMAEYIGDSAMETRMFTPTEQDGMIEMTFTFDSTVLTDLHYDKLVVCETIFSNGGIGWKPICSHWDFSYENNSQSIDIPDVRTTATAEDGSHNLAIEPAIQTVTDRVYYENLVTGTDYTIVGSLQYTATDANGNVTSGPLVQNGQEVRASVTFTPTTSSGYVDITFTVDVSDLMAHGYEKLVAYEELYAGPGVLVGLHADINDEGQTVSVPMYLRVRIAKADANNVRYFLRDAEITIYNGDGSVATDANGNPCVGVTDANGIVEFVIIYNANNTYYAMETRAPSGYSINPDKFYITPTSERDADGIVLVPISIFDYTIVVPPRTGDDMNLGLWITVAIVSLVGIAGGTVFFLKKKKKENDNTENT